MKIEHQIILLEMHHCIAQMNVAAAACAALPSEDHKRQHLREAFMRSGQFEQKKAELEALIAEDGLK